MSMNIYFRYFDDEKICFSLDGVYEAVVNISGVTLDDRTRQDIADYVEGRYSGYKRINMPGQSNYFVLIKTNAATMEEFKAYAQREASEHRENVESEKELLAQVLNEEKVGWYQAYVLFKRVTPNDNGKFHYTDTEFRAKVKAYSIQNCYDRVIRHLRSRSDVDPRSQFPSIKGRNFQVEYLGMEG